MARWIQKLSVSGGQYRVTIPRYVVEMAELEKAKVVEIWVNKSKTIQIKEYDGKKAKK